MMGCKHGMSFHSEVLNTSASRGLISFLLADHFVSILSHLSPTLSLSLLSASHSALFSSSTTRLQSNSRLHKTTNVSSWSLASTWIFRPSEPKWHQSWAWISWAGEQPLLWQARFSGHTSPEGQLPLCSSLVREREGEREVTTCPPGPFWSSCLCLQVFHVPDTFCPTISCYSQQHCLHNNTHVLGDFEARLRARWVNHASSAALTSKTRRVRWNTWTALSNGVLQLPRTSFKPIPDYSAGHDE